MKHFISVINAAVPFGRGLNALAHTAVGIGHWMPSDKTPKITVLFAEPEIVYQFRQAAHKLLQSHPNQVICSEFTNTMTVGTTENCLKTTLEIPENQLTYYASSVCADEGLLNNDAIKEITAKCKMLKNYESFSPEEQDNNFSFRNESPLPDYRTLPIHKITLILDRKVSPSLLVNATVASSLSVGMQGDLNQLKLLMYIDADQQRHPYISYHSFPILAAKHQNNFNGLADIIQNDQNVLKKIIKDNEGNVIAICMLGTEDQINTHSRQRYISLWSTELPEDAFVSVK